MIRGGWLYNISGYDAVQLNMRNGKVVQIGTDEQAVLLEAIEKAMAFKRAQLAQKKQMTDVLTRLTTVSSKEEELVNE